MIDWRESNLTRKPAAFVHANTVVKLAAIIIGFTVSTLSVMAALALVRPLEDRLVVRAVIAAIIALLVPGVLAYLRVPKDDPLVAIGVRSETYALVLLGFAVLFVVGAHDRTASLLTSEADRAERWGWKPVAQLSRYLARGTQR